ncbi:MAG: hypothetical protein RLY97_746 [Pseudomonadota bacterium]
MSDPVVFESSTPRFGLPMLYAGQAQKEVFVNEAHALTDALLFCAIEGEAAAPPASPMAGSSWLVAAAPSGVWLGQAGKIASFQSGNWLFTAPKAGMRVLNRVSGQDMRFVGSWQTPAKPATPSGGAVVDSEVRTALGQLILALESAGIFAHS